MGLLLRLAGLDLATHTIRHQHTDGLRQMQQSDLVNLGEAGVEMFVSATAS